MKLETPNTWMRSNRRQAFQVRRSEVFWTLDSQSASVSGGGRSFLSFSVKMLARALIMLCLVGCTKTWETIGPPDMYGSNALAAVSSFTATNGWDTYAETNHDLCWEDLDPKFYISGIPWKQWSGKSFQAYTREGILYVLLGDAFHHDYYGVAYNPNTNRFPEWIRGFKPIGNHWYAWAQPEFWYSAKTEGRYE